MCAIFGIIGKSDLQLLKKMSKCQFYRGPDKQSFFISKKNNISLGMNRLSVIDKKNGNQPMFSHDKRHLLVFNGAIYNFLEIRKYLEKKISFKTNSDTEVLVNAFNYWGKKCFNYFDGMWASAIYDFKTQTTYLSRDYMGQKPLFYNQKHSNLIFSSQINGIFKVNNNFKFSIKNTKEYFRFNHYPAPLTGYEKIFQVSPGETILFNKNKISKKKYWDFAKGGDYNNLFKKNNDEEINKSFSKIIKNFSIADENVGLCLSPGIDSQLIKVYLEKFLKKIKSFTVGFEDQTYDESRFIKSTSKNKNYKKILKKNDYEKIFKLIGKKIYFPFGDSSVIPTYQVFNLVKKKTNVTLTGDGGDELFFGYLAFKGFYYFRLFKLIFPTFILKIFKYLFGDLKTSNKYFDFKKKLRFFFRYIDKNNHEILKLWISNFDKDDEKNYFKIANSNVSKVNNDLKNLYAAHSDKMKFSQIFFMKFYLPLILIKADFSSMLNSVESRAPYLSKDLINYSIDRSSKNNFSILSQRPLMKKIFKKAFLGISEKKKHGFAFNKQIILNNQKLIRSCINESFLINRVYFNKKYKLYLNGDLSYEQYLWNEIMLNFTRQNLEK